MHNWDLHCHTTASDGQLSPNELITRASALGIEHLAITDHDTAAGFFMASDLAKQHQINLIPGIELSCRFGGQEIHIIGLKFYTNNLSNDAFLQNQQTIRKKRFSYLLTSLAKKLPDINEQDIRSSLHSTQDHNTDPVKTTQYGRGHLANWLVINGLASDKTKAFKQFLKPIRLSKMIALWPHVQQGVEWITQKGGLAVLAHPAQYNLSRTKLNLLIHTFKEAGGVAMEVVRCRQQLSERADLHRLCQQHQLLASGGSDFHSQTTGVELGHFSPLPSDCCPIHHKIEIPLAPFDKVSIHSKHTT